MPRNTRSVRPSQCAICSHVDRVRIEALRVGGASLDAIAGQFGVSRDSVHRHFKNHVTDKRRAELMAGPMRVEELANAAATESKGLLEQLSIVRSVLLNQFLNAAEASDRPGVAMIAGRLLESLRELGRITGELRELSGVTINNTVNLYASPEFVALQDGLLRLARAHPEARADIVALLRGLEPSAPVIKANGAHPPMIEHEATNAA